jgi:hypothetical protein
MILKYELNLNHDFSLKYEIQFLKYKFSFKNMSPLPELNRQPTVYDTVALPIKLRGHFP